MSRCPFCLIGAWFCVSGLSSVFASTVNYHATGIAHGLGNVFLCVNGACSSETPPPEVTGCAAWAYDLTRSRTCTHSDVDVNVYQGASGSGCRETYNDGSCQDWSGSCTLYTGSCPTPTPTATPTTTPTATPTATASATATPTATPTSTAPPSPTPDPTGSPGGGGTPPTISPPPSPNSSPPPGEAGRTWLSGDDYHAPDNVDLPDIDPEWDPAEDTVKNAVTDAVGQVNDVVGSAEDLSIDVGAWSGMNFGTVTEINLPLGGFWSLMPGSHEAVSSSYPIPSYTAQVRQVLLWALTCAFFFGSIATIFKLGSGNASAVGSK